MSGIKDKFEQVSSSIVSVDMLLPSVKFCSNRQAIVDGCKGVVEYNDGIVKLNCGKLVLKFQGQNLSIRALCIDQIAICGQILSFEFLT